ncbi:6359_t:CDS:2, partial [Racocetra persica]
KCRIADDAKLYLAKQHEMRLIPVVAKNYNTTFDLYEQVSNNIYIGRPDKFQRANLLLAECIKNNRSVFTDKKKEFQFYLDIYKNIRGYKDFTRTKLIECYKYGVGVSKHDEKALKFIKESLNK